MYVLVNLGAALVGCGGDTGESPSDPPSSTTDDSTTGDPPAPTDGPPTTVPPTDPPTDTDPPSGARSGLLVRFGTLVYDGAALSGEERLTVLGDSGYGAAVCEIRYDITSTLSRSDCPGCIWAFDVVYGGAEVVLDLDASCLTGAGYDASTVAALNGVASSRAFHPDYVGHKEVLMSDLGSGFQAVSYVELWDAASGTLTYDWDDGVVFY